MCVLVLKGFLVFRCLNVFCGFRIFGILVVLGFFCGFKALGLQGL